MNDKEKIEEIREILDGLKWYGSEYRYRPLMTMVKTEPSKWINPDDYDRDNIDAMIEEINDVVDSE